MKRIIEFEEYAPGDLNLISPLQPPSSTRFQDLILKPDFAGLKYTIPKGTSKFRILPTIKGSPLWMTSIHALTHSSGRHAHPKSTQPSASSVFDVAQDWLRQNNPDALYRKTNPSGHKLWSSPLTACWIVVDGPEHPQLRILIASAFSGARNAANAGLGHQIHELVRQNTQLLDSKAGFQVKITRSYSPNSRFPETQLSVIHSDTSLNEVLGELSSEELQLVCPIMDIIREIDAEQEWALLSNTIGPEMVSMIRAASAAP